MKRFILLSATMLLSIILSAQTQQGYVKTKGRMVNGKHIPGKGLKGATVSIKGRTTVLVNADDGAFSFPVPETKFRVDSVRKKGYQLVDIDALNKTYKPSQKTSTSSKPQVSSQKSARQMWSALKRYLTNNDFNVVKKTLFNNTALMLNLLPFGQAPPWQGYMKPKGHVDCLWKPNPRTRSEIRHNILYQQWISVY